MVLKKNYYTLRFFNINTFELNYNKITIKRTKQKMYLHKPSGIISKRLLAAENTCNDDNLPIPEGIPSKSN